MKTILRKYKIKASVNMRVLLLSDLHSHYADDAIGIAIDTKPDIITLAGDITEKDGIVELEKSGVFERTHYIEAL